ncbi:hypothetical protein Rhow_003484 [Rhodococcus wratislaviensis]|uniref:Uncharacterized protein n=1 Tax=Rhodococcus wratislaviensis TaxID=44752 RepID=A0A402C8B5_RHOWR|nr:hypothetical protein Rhow_003484 [Rhodococcus wratislaviensis]
MSPSCASVTRPSITDAPPGADTAVVGPAALNGASAGTRSGW